MDTVSLLFEWLTDPGNWTGSTGILARVVEHLYMSGLAVALATVVALPIGMLIGHTRRAEFFAVSLANVGRALPSFGVLALVFPFTLRYLPGIGFYPTLIALVLLAIPPILTNTYVGVRGVDEDAIESARGMGMTEREVLLRLELPLAAPLIVAGLRVAAVAVVATATLGAFVSWGGLGRFIVDGFAIRSLETGEAMLVGGAFLVAVLAVATDLAFGLLERIVTPKGERKRSGKRASASEPTPAHPDLAA